MANTETRKAPINIRALAAQRNLIDSAAAAVNKSRSDFMLEAACREAENVLLDQRLFFVQEEEFAAFEAALKTPAAEAMKKILAARAPWED
ncbi:DUF1778 domain-containing protein [Desulfoprunum benzoelyticum]|uniref:Uncharacterized protein (DUF1778 family) n=1 Tax=Desulfoprunum benzoelyticum TaxID=1506996 RepID=A0A840V3J7_9BACT|nr:DUF1778 domain-containing protein [Desulfoprunum benzoelyticum]MBB5347701.1 uncharacterized protein (DUF1778 family) [Desulfoprunum benzoelyticum]MBM9529294.1 DUF1778 domain-containing protein [Desulfoprunum benzoelyticum]